MNERRQQDSRLARALLIGGGSACVALGLIGVFLPVLPTTPFLLLASACLARGSKRMHSALLKSRLFGHFLTEWREYRAITRATRARALFMVLATMTVSILLVQPTSMKVLLGVLCSALVMVVLRLPIRPRPCAMASAIEGTGDAPINVGKAVGGSEKCP